MYVSEICDEGIYVSFRTKNVKRRSKIAIFQMSAILKFDLKLKQLHFSEENYLNYTQNTQFCMQQLHFQ